MGFKCGGQEQAVIGSLKIRSTQSYVLKSAQGTKTCMNRDTLLAKMASITQAIKDAGLTMADFGLTEHVATKKTRKPRQASAVKYRTPEGQEWTGVGRKPAWAKDLTAEQLAAFEVGATKPVEIDFSQLVAKQVTDDFGDAVLVD